MQATHDAVRNPARYTERVLGNFAAAGGPVNPRLPALARALLRVQSPQEAFATIREHVPTGSGGRRVTDAEIGKAIQQAGGPAPATYTPPPVNGVARSRKWPARDLDAIRAACRNRAPQMEILREGVQGIPRATDPQARAAAALDLLFPADPLLCASGRREKSVVARRSAFAGKEARLQFIVPRPALALSGTTKDGRPSPRARDNFRTGTAYMAVEADFTRREALDLMPREWRLDHTGEEVTDGTDGTDVCLAIIAELRRWAPLACVVHSGGKSLHAWFRVNDMPRPDIYEFARKAVSLGADPATFAPNQWVRMPGGLRDGATRQEILFLDPAETLTTADHE